MDVLNYISIGPEVPVYLCTTYTHNNNDTILYITLGETREKKKTARRWSCLSPYTHTHKRKPLSPKRYKPRGKVRGPIDFRSGCASGGGSGDDGNPSVASLLKKKINLR